MTPSDRAPTEPTSSDTQTEPDPGEHALRREDALVVRRALMALAGSAGEVDAVLDEAPAKSVATATENPKALALELYRRALWARLDRAQPSSVEVAEDAAAAVRTRSALSALRPSEREALVYRFLAGLDEQAIATACGTNRDEVERRLNRGLSQLTGPLPAPTADCKRVADDSAGLARGVLPRALAEHVLECDACRDLRHEVSQCVERVAHAGDDLPESQVRESALSSAVERFRERAAVRAEAPPPSPPDVREPVARKAGKSPRLYALFGGLGVAALFGVLSLFTGRPGGGEIGARGARVERLSSASDGDGLRACAPSGTPCKRLGRGDRIPAGSRVESDESTRADIELNDGIRVLVDRNTEFVLAENGKAAIELVRGVVIADVEEGEELGLKLRHGGGKLGPGTFNLRSAGDDAVIEVTRGGANLFGKSGSTSAGAGEQVRVGPGGTRISRSSNLGALGFGERADEATDGSSRGLGELRAKKPGTDSELKGSVRLTSHAVRVRVAGALARTEIEEVFSNTTDQVLEGIYRFPLPADAQIERLALEVDGKLLDGAFVERDRAAAIWRGAIVNAAKDAPRPREEIVWVPGPWRDPALLEWQRGGRFELRVFPIPAGGSRRIVLAYTQMLAPAGDVRRYTYPLAHDPSATTRVDRFTVDVKLRGHDKSFGVQTYGYEPTRRDDGDALELSMERREFSPLGDLVIEYALPDSNAELKAWAYAGGAPSAGSFAPPGPLGSDAQAPYVTLALRPELPRTGEHGERAFAVVVDSSRSMFGENYSRATKLAGRIARELDPSDRIVVLACDSECRSSPDGLTKPGEEAETRALAFFASIEPDGASDPSRAVEAAYRALGSRGSRAARVVYIGDAVPTMGPIRPAEIERAVERALPKEHGQLTAVGVGVESDSEILSALARGGGGVVIPYAPGTTLTRAARGVLGAAYGHALRDVEVRLPEGLYAPAPARLDSIPAGGEAVLAARMSSREVKGDVVLRGRVNGTDFERRYPLELRASESEGNAFAPRQYAALRIRDLERQNDAEAKRQAIALSTGFNVASRYTSLLVLESQAMFKAFGLDNARTAPVWSGDELAEGETVSEDPAFAESKAELGFPSDPLDSAFEGGGSGARHERERVSSGRAARKAAKGTFEDFAAPPPAAAPAPSKPLDRHGPEALADSPPLLREPSRPMIPMRRIWERFGEIDDAQRVPKAATPEAIERAEREAAQDENRREATRKLYVLLSLAGELERAERVVERWVGRDPLDPEALTARADLAARRGDRERAIRLLGSVIDVRPGDVRAQRRLERLQRWAGRAELGCRHLVAAAELHQDDAALLADAVRCARDNAEPEFAARLLSSASAATQRAAEVRAAQRASVDSELSGDLRVEATWSSGVDLDLSLLDPDGHRVSWLGAPTKAVIAARNVTAAGSEALSLRGAKPGQYVIELVRPHDVSAASVSGSLVVTAAGKVRTIPFRLDETRKAVALVDIKMRSRLVPLSNPDRRF